MLIFQLLLHTRRLIGCGSASHEGVPVSQVCDTSALSFRIGPALFLPYECRSSICGGGSVASFAVGIILALVFNAVEECYPVFACCRNRSEFTAIRCEQAHATRHSGGRVFFLCCGRHGISHGSHRCSGKAAARSSSAGIHPTSLLLFGLKFTLI
jgi:hypothetical protein